MVIGITGSIASGKSLVSNYLIKKGFKVIDADKIAKEVFEKKLKKIKKLFPNAIIGGKIDKKQIALEIFNSKENKEKLENLIHPLVFRKIKQKIKENKERLIFVDLPLLYETNSVNLFDKVVVVYVTKDIQVKRLMERDNIDESYALKKIVSQKSMEEKKNEADFVIDNSKTQEETFRQVDEVLEKIK